MIGIKRFNGEYLTVGTTGHKGNISYFDWEDTRLSGLDLDLYQTIVINFLSIPINSFSDQDSPVTLYKRGTDGRFKEVGRLPKSIIHNLTFLDKNLAAHRQKEGLNVFFILGVANTFVDDMFNEKLYMSRNTANTIQYSYDNIGPYKLSDGSDLVEFELIFFQESLFGVEKENISMVNASELVSGYFDEYRYFNFVFTPNDQHTPLAHTFYNRILSFMMSIHDIDTIILPHPRLVDPFDATEIVLRKIVKLDDTTKIAVPNWMDSYNTLRQNELRSEIREIHQQIDSLKDQIREREANFNVIREFQQILYTRQKRLSKSIYILLGTMGIDAKWTRDTGYHDFEIEDDGYLLIFQAITMDDHIVERKDLRQLNQFVEEKEESIDFSKPVKGVLIVSYNTNKDPIERKNLHVEEVALRYIQKHKFAILTVNQLYEAYLLVGDRQEMDKNQFLDHICETVGPVTNKQLILHKTYNESMP